MNAPFRPLGKVRDIVQATDLDISYAYDDLIFSDHAAFMIRFDDRYHEKLYLYFNETCDKEEAKVLEGKLKAAGAMDGFEVTNAGLFALTQLEGKEELEIKFL